MAGKIGKLIKLGVACGFSAITAGALAQNAPDANGPSDDAAATTDTVEYGVQGSPNPLRRDRVYITREDLLDDSFPNSFPIPGGDARMRIGGYVKLDAIQDLDYVGDRFEFELASIPVAGTPEAALDGITTLHAKESRFNLDYRTMARNEKYGWEFPLRVFIELDFFDDRESFRYQPRLRLAYGTFGRLLAGRYWSTTTDLTALTGTIDFSAGDSLYGGRVSQVRWSDEFGKSMKWAVGVEDAQHSIGNPSNLGGEGRTSLPTFAGMLRWEGQQGSHMQLGTDLFRLEWQGGVAGPSDTEMGYGVSLSGRYLMGDSKKNAISGAATVGSGAANRVISLSYDGGADAVITPQGLDVMTHKQIYVGYSRYWTESFHSSFTVATAELDNSVFQPGSAIHKATSFHANLVWFPYERVSTGIEFMTGKRENFSGADGDANRIQFMMKYSFN